MHLFQSATLKLTVWYLAILMAISMAFSVLVYQLAIGEVTVRLETLQHNLLDENTIQNRVYSILPNPTAADLLTKAELDTASKQMVESLIKVNIVVLVAGGMASYLMALRSLKPIKRAHEAQSRFTSDASHELRTPLSVMKAELEVSLRDTALTLPEARELLESNLEEVNKLISLTEMLLHLSRLEYSKLEVVKIDIAELLTAILDKHPQTDRFIVTSRKKSTTYANEAAISEVMEILIDNALKHSPEGSLINIRTFEQRGNVAFRIKNTGKPISKQAIDRLFDRFYRSDQSRTKRDSSAGYGLGLSIAKKIVDVHGGYITVSSNSKETNFTFFLPIVKRSYTKNA